MSQSYGQIKLMPGVNVEEVDHKTEWLQNNKCHANDIQWSLQTTKGNLITWSNSCYIGSMMTICYVILDTLYYLILVITFIIIYKHQQYQHSFKSPENSNLFVM